MFSFEQAHCPTERDALPHALGQGRFARKECSFEEDEQRAAFTRNSAKAMPTNIRARSLRTARRTRGGGSKTGEAVG